MGVLGRIVQSFLARLVNKLRCRLVELPLLEEPPSLPLCYRLGELLPDAVLFQQNGEVIFANPACVQLLGAEVQEEIVGRATLDLFHPDSYQAVESLIRQAGEECAKISLTGEKLVSLDRGVIVVDISAVRATAQTGDLIMMTLERRGLEMPALASDRKFRRIIENLRDGIYLIDSDGIIIYWSRGTVKITGINYEETIGRYIWDVMARLLGQTGKLTEHLRSQTLGWLEEMGTAWSEHWLEQRFRRSGGSLRVVQTMIFPIETESGMIGCALLHDITERHKVEQALEKHNRALHALHEVMVEIGAHLDLTTLLRYIAERAITLIAAGEGASVFLYRPEEQVLRLEAAHGVGAPYLGMKVAPGKGVTGRVFKTRQPLFVNDYASWDGRLSTIEKSTFSSVLGVPLLRKEEVLGVLLLFTKRTQRIFTEEDVWLAKMFAAQAVNAIVNARLYHELEIYSEGLEEAVHARTSQLERIKDRTEAILDSSPDAILLLREDGVINAFNPAFSEFFGHELEDVYGQTPTMLVDPVHATDFSRVLRLALEQGEPGRLDVVAWRQDGTTFDAGVALAPIAQNGEVTGLICSFRDISALKEVERMKDAFVSNVSHELRTPIASIRLYHDLLGRNPKKTQIYMERLRRETDRLQRIVEDLLFLSRMDQGQMRLRRKAVDLGKLVEQYVIDRTALANQRGLRLVFEDRAGLPVLEVDEGLIGQALSIILTNALNYTPAGGEVRVKTVVQQEHDGLWAGVSISDTGPGILPEERPRLFQRFFRGSAAHELGTPGTGLGLAMVKEIMVRHRGRVEVVSSGVSGEGSTFCLWLPVAARPGSNFI